MRKRILSFMYACCFFALGMFIAWAWVELSINCHTTPTHCID